MRKIKQKTEEAVAESIAEASVQTLETLCNSPAPLIINGGMYCGCQLPAGHDLPHEVRITWS